MGQKKKMFLVKMLFCRVVSCIVLEQNDFLRCFFFDWYLVRSKLECLRGLTLSEKNKTGLMANKI